MVRPAQHPLLTRVTIKPRLHPVTPRERCRELTLPGATVGCPVELSKAHALPSSTTWLPGSGCLGTAQPRTLLAPPATVRERILVAERSCKAASVSHSPPRTRCFARQQTRPVLEPTLSRLCHPVHHPGLAAGLKVAGDEIRSSFIFRIPLRGRGVVVYAGVNVSCSDSA